MPVRKKDENNNDNTETHSTTTNESTSFRTNTRGTRQRNMSLTLMYTNIQEIFDVLKNHRTEGNRLLSDIFLRLPVKRSNPEYYKIIKDPIDLLKIQQKIKSDEYKKFEDFDTDIKLLISNAKLYNPIQSREHKDAVLLSEIYESEKRKKNFDGPSLKNSGSNENEFINSTFIKKENEYELNPIKETSNEKKTKCFYEEIKSDDKKSRGRLRRHSVSLTSNEEKQKHESLNYSTDTDQKTYSSFERTKRIKYTNELDLNLYLEDFFDLICSYQDESLRYLANIFYLLPSPTDYPDYYDIIKNPIDLKTIAKKLYTYKSLKQMEGDLTLMTDNAKRYNDPKSIIYKDANKLKKKIKEWTIQLNNLLNQGKQFESSKTREKKQKIIQEVGQMGVEELNNLLAERWKEVKKEEENGDNQENDENESDNEEEDEDDESEQEEEEDEDEGDNDDESSRPPKMARGRKSRVSSVKMETTEDSNENSISRTPRKNNLMKIMWSLFDHLKEFKHNNQNLIDPFVKLPSKTIYPDYYEEIKKPIALNGIKRKLNQRLYRTFKEMVDDCELMFKNALQYNLEESLIYQNAKRLLETLHSKAAELQVIANNLPPITVGTASPSGGTPTKKSLKNDQPSSGSKKLLRLPIRQQLPKFTDLKEKLIYLYNYINDFVLDERELAYPFRVLPSRTEYADYYNIIKKPIDMTKIWNKINQQGSVHQYTSLDDMCLDFAQMYENACVYNEPNSTIYKDALTLQRELFNKRDEIVQADINSSITDMSKISPNEIAMLESLPNSYVMNELHDLIDNLFESCMQYQDLEGRVLSESFVDLYNLYANKLKSQGKYDDLNDRTIEPILTFELIRQKVKQRSYNRLDVFQEEMFQVFNQVRLNSYLETNSERANLEENKFKIHRYSQFFKDAYELQRFFISKRDELCKNGELLISGALSFKLTSLDAYITAYFGLTSTFTSSFDESEVLLVESRYRPLESKLTDRLTDFTQENLKYNVGHFYYVNRNLIKSSLSNANEFKFSDSTNKTNENLIVCLLASNKSQTQLIVQIYLQPNDDEFIDFEFKKTHKHFDKEVFKTDLYAFIDLNNQTDIMMKPCLVIGVKDYIANELKLIENKMDTESDEKPKINLNINDIFVCESFYSTCFRYFRKLINKKWSPLSFISSSSNPLQNSQIFNIELLKRDIPLLLSRSFLKKDVIDRLIREIDEKISFKVNSFGVNLFKYSNRETIQYETTPAALAAAAAKERDADEMEHTEDDSNSELMKTAKYYEQVFYIDNEIYKLGDYVYVNYQPLSNSANIKSEEKLPLIVRIDRLWSINQNDQIQYFLRGPLFLRPVEVIHEPTRLFYRNEVFKEISRELTVSLDQVVFSNNLTNKKKCIVMNSKKFCSSRVTEIDERDVYVCETKYSLLNKTFRKFTKGLRKFELSLKCSEDEIYFLRRELQLRKHISPVLATLNINYDDNTEINENQAKISKMRETSENYSPNEPVSNLNDDDISDGNKDDENTSESSSQNENSNTTDNTLCIASNSFQYCTTKGIILPSKISKTPETLSALGLSFTGGKIRRKRSKKTAFNIFSKEFRKRLRDTKSSLSFDRMSKEVGNQWRALSDKEKAAYEEKARIATIKEAEERAAIIATHLNNPIIQQVQQQPQTSQSSNSTNSHHSVAISLPQHPNHINHILATRQVSLEQQQYQQQQQQLPYSSEISINRRISTDSQHKEVYIRYIANMRRLEQINQSSSFNPIIKSSIVQPDWYKSIDIRASNITENKLTPPPTEWIENCCNNEIHDHLLKMRYHLLNDAINIEKQLISNTSQDNEEFEMTIEQDDEFQNFSSN